MVDNLDGSIYTHVRRDEHLLQLVEHVGIDRRAAGNGARELGKQALLGLLEACVQLLLLGLLLLGLGSVISLLEYVK